MWKELYFERMMKAYMSKVKGKGIDGESETKGEVKGWKKGVCVLRVLCCRAVWSYEMIEMYSSEEILRGSSSRIVGDDTLNTERYL